MRFLKSTVLSALLTLTTAELYPGQSNKNHTCQLQTPYLSCSTQAFPNKTDSCCTETYGGLVMLTQFWNTYTGLESKGQVLPKYDWTIHGLWPDFCNGSYTQYCDLNRQYDRFPAPNTTNGLPNGTVVPAYNGSSVSTFIEAFGKYDLLAYMKKYWTGLNQPSSYLWEHEFSKHATCFSTFDLPCYGPKYQKHEDVVEFFETTVLFNRQISTYSWLQADGIVPSNETTYTLSAIQAALTKGFGALPYIGCSGPRFNETSAGNGTTDNGRTFVSEVWYYHHTFGRVQSGNGVPVDADSNGLGVSSCAKAKGALKYAERSKGSEV